MIEGVLIKELVTHTDERGFFRELVRNTDDFFQEGFGQWSHSMMYQGATKAWHIHQQQIDWWYVAAGVLKVVLHDLRPGSSSRGKTDELLLGDGLPAKIVKVPPGVAHGCKALSAQVHLFYITNSTYDPTDEGRIPHNDPSIGYDWLKGPKIT